VAGLGLGDRVTLRPPVPPDQVAALMHEHDLLVHASRLETFGMTVIEAIATGTPVLVARSQGPAETLAGLEDSAGQTFEPTDDPEVIASAYRKLRARFDSLDLPDARAQLLARYGSAAVAAQLREIYTAPRGERGPELPPPPTRPAVRRLAARLPAPAPEAILRRLQRIGRRLARGVGLGQ
jgi:glycosyltransferase involved in cell wall biosynthesis